MMVTLDTRVTAAPDFLAVVRDRVAADPGREVFCDYRARAMLSDPDGYAPRRVTSKAFLDRAAAVAAGLRASGVRPGDVVALQLPNRHEFVVFQLALYAIGAVAMPVSPIYRLRDVTRMLKLARAVGLVVPREHGSFDYQDMAIRVRRDLASLKHVVAVGAEGSLADGVVSDDELAALGQGNRQILAEVLSGQWVPQPDQPMLLNFTSGTTGEPKGVLHSRKSVGYAVKVTAERLQLSAEDVSVVVPTMGHAAGFLNGIYIALLVGLRTVYLDQWEPAAALQVLAKERATYAPIMPPYLVDLLARPDFADFDLSTWRTARVSGGPIPRDVLSELSKRLPQLRLCPGWGMSEALYVTCAGPDDPEEARHNTDGRAVGSCRIEIRDVKDEKKPVAIGDIGQILIQAPSMMLGYFDRPDLTQASFTEDGWYRTGDLGVLDTAGFLSVKGRLKELVVRGGENVPVVDIEFLLAEHPDIASAVVVGVPDARLGERVCAVITLRPGAQPPTLEALRDYMNSLNVTKQFIPEYLVVTEKLPTTPTGKIVRAEVRDAALRMLKINDSPIEKERMQ